MTKRRDQGFDDIRKELDIRLDGLFGELGRSLGDILNRLDDADGELRHSRTIGGGDAPMRAEAGFRVRLGGAEFSGRMSTDPAKPADTNRPDASAASADDPATDETRDIAATVLETSQWWRLGADLPGIAEDALDLALADGRLTIRAVADDRSFSGSFDVPEWLTLDAVTATMTNGVLTLEASR